MKLLHLTQRRFLFAAAPLFVLAGFVLYWSLQCSIRYFAEEQMQEVAQQITQYVQLHDTLPVFFQSVDNHLYASALPKDETFNSSFSDTLLLNPLEDELEPFYCLHFLLPWQGQRWKMTLCKSALENEDLAFTVFVLFATLCAGLFLALIWINGRVSRQVWHPFFHTLAQMRDFRLSKNTILKPEATNVDEFKELHRSLQELTDKVQLDFQMVQQFTENASHELQTPLAVVQNKVETLLQDPSLNEAQLQQLYVVQQSVRRMARLNKSLLLLTKIENDQFAKTESLELAALIEKRLAWFDDFIAEKELIVKKSLHAKTLQANVFLTETVLSNLLANAIKHNLPGGQLSLQLDTQKLVIVNSGPAPDSSFSTLKRRFTRGNTSSDGLGLGLAIVQEICDKYGWQLNLAFDNHAWSVTLAFE